ncbi:uncharacterized protein LOC115229141 [Octopus sinensis]|uniref:Uncharacterized protein LOC115229141 n=1 Tax=Octopus sinensis TaxID=2607531 RepID=A0A6P7TZP8_9MOLL|nr:uncharacterized protein LOC115229141 [Octopus sinensis]
MDDKYVHTIQPGHSQAVSTHKIGSTTNAGRNSEVLATQTGANDTSESLINTGENSDATASPTVPNESPDLIAKTSENSDPTANPAAANKTPDLIAKTGVNSGATASPPAVNETPDLIAKMGKNSDATASPSVDRELTSKNKQVSSEYEKGVFDSFYNKYLYDGERGIKAVIRTEAQNKTQLNNLISEKIAEITREHCDSCSRQMLGYICLSKEINE